MKHIAAMLLACAFSTAAFAQASAPVSGDRTPPSARDETKVNGLTADTVPMAKSGQKNALPMKKKPFKKNPQEQAASKPAM